MITSTLKTLRAHKVVDLPELGLRLELHRRFFVVFDTHNVRIRMITPHEQEIIQLIQAERVLTVAGAQQGGK